MSYLSGLCFQLLSSGMGFYADTADGSSQAHWIFPLWHLHHEQRSRHYEDISGHLAQGWHLHRLVYDSCFLEYILALACFEAWFSSFPVIL